MIFPTYFRIALFLPIIFGVIAGTLLIETFVGFLALALIAEGISYFVMITLVFTWSLGRTEHQLKVVSLLLPLVFVPIVLVRHLINGNINSTDIFMEYFTSFGVMVLIVGYFYVFFAWVIWGVYSVLKSEASDVT